MSNQSTFGHARQYEWLSAFMNRELEVARERNNNEVDFCAGLIQQMALELAEDNANFQMIRFIADCGLTVTVRDYGFHVTSDLKSETVKCPKIQS